MLPFKHASTISPFRALGLSDFASEADVIREHKKLVQICQYDGRPDSDPVEIAKMLTKAKDEAVAICQKKQQEKEKAHAEFQQGLTEWEKHQKEIVEHVEELRPFTEPELTSKFISHDYLCKRLRAMANELLKNSKNYMRYDDSYISGYYNFVKHLKQAVRDREAEVSKLKEELERCRNETAGDLERGCAVADELAQGDDVSKADQLTRDDAGSKVDQLIQERDAALSKVNELTQERDNAISKVNELTQERDNALSKVNELTRDMDSASSNIEELAREKEHAMREKTDALLRVSELTAERDTALSKIIELTADKDAKVSELTAERDNARSIINEPRIEKDSRSTDRDEGMPIPSAKRQRHARVLSNPEENETFKKTVSDFIEAKIKFSQPKGSFLTPGQIIEEFKTNGFCVPSDTLFFKEVRNQLELNHVTYKNTNGNRKYEGISFND